MRDTALQIGIFADTHDNVPHIAQAVKRFNAANVDLVLFAGDLVSTICVPPLRKLSAPVIGCFGDNEGNKPGILSGFRIVGQLSEPPVQVTANDGTRIVLVHMRRQLRGLASDYDVAVFAHTHKPRIELDTSDRLLLNPGEAGGWSFGKPTIAFLDTASRVAYIDDLF